MRKLIHHIAPTLAALAFALTFAACSGGDDPVAVTGVTLPAALDVEAGKTGTLTATIVPANATNKAVAWASSDAAVASVPEGFTGLAVTITAGADKAGGTATVTVKTADGGHEQKCTVTVTPALVSSITITPNQATVLHGSTVALEATVAPANAANQAVTWSSGDETVATVTQAGLVAGLKLGTVTITARAQDGSNVSGVCAVTVAPVLVEFVSLAPAALALAPGATATLAAAVLPANASDNRVEFSTSDAGVVTVTQAGLAALVTAGGEGSATITATAMDGSGKFGVCAVTVAIGNAATVMPPATLAAGNYHSTGIKENDGLWAWGDNYYGQLGDGTNDNRMTPVQVGASTTDWVSVACHEHTVALKADGSLWAWGYNWYGQVGDDSNTNRQTPVPVSGGSDWIAVSAGQYHTVAIKADGSLWAWGQNLYRQLGDGTQEDRYSPVRVGEDDDWIAVSAGFNHNVAIKADGSLWAWGDGFWGQLGDGCSGENNTPRPRPYRVGDGDDWAAVAAGSYHSLAIKKDGSLWAWGYNSYGMLGLGDMMDRNTPQPVPGGDVWASVSAGQHHTMAIKANGSLWTCGANSYGQLGDGTSDERHSFVPVMAGATDWAAVAAGAFHTLAVRDGGDVYAWGRNIFGAVGDGSSDDRNLPVKIGEGYRVPAK